MKKAFYGFVEMGVNAVETFIRLHLLVFYSQKVGIPSFWVGVALSISIFCYCCVDFVSHMTSENGVVLVQTC